MRCGKVRVFVSAGFLALGCAAVAHGSAVPISYALQSRSVSATAATSGAPRGGTSSVPSASQQSNSQQAGGFGTFSGNVSAIAGLGAESAQSSASAVQNSSLAATGFADSGFVESNSVLGTGQFASASSSSVFNVTFNVSQTEGYTFTANVSGAGGALASIRLTSSSGANLFAPISTIKLSNFEAEGVLHPGTYSVMVDASAATMGTEGGMLNFSAALADGPVVAASSAVASAVPVPAAWMSSSVMLAVLGLIAGARRRIPTMQ